MKLVKEDKGGVDVLTVTGKLDSTNASEFDARLREDVDETSGRPVVLEFAGVLTLTSAPLRAILSLAKRMQRHGATLLVAAPGENALESLRISGFLKLKIFELTDTLDAALAKARQATLQPVKPRSIASAGGPLPGLPPLPATSPPLQPAGPPATARPAAGAAPTPAEPTRVPAPSAAAPARSPAPAPALPTPAASAAQPAPQIATAAPAPAVAAAPPKLHSVPTTAATLPAPAQTSAAASPAAPSAPAPAATSPPAPGPASPPPAEPPKPKPAPKIVDPFALPQQSSRAAVPKLESKAESAPARTPAPKLESKADPKAGLARDSTPAAKPAPKPAAPTASTPQPPPARPPAPEPRVQSATGPVPREGGLVGWFNYWACEVQDALDYWLGGFRRK